MTIWKIPNSKFMVRSCQYVASAWLEENVSSKEDIPLEQGIKATIKRPFEIVTAFDLLKNIK